MLYLTHELDEVLYLTHELLAESDPVIIPYNE